MRQNKLLIISAFVCLMVLVGCNNTVSSSNLLTTNTQGNNGKIKKELVSYGDVPRPEEEYQCIGNLECNSTNDSKTESIEIIDKYTNEKQIVYCENWVNDKGETRQSYRLILGGTKYITNIDVFYVSGCVTENGRIYPSGIGKGVYPFESVDHTGRLGLQCNNLEEFEERVEFDENGLIIRFNDYRGKEDLIYTRNENGLIIKIERYNNYYQKFTSVDEYYYDDNEQLVSIINDQGYDHEFEYDEKGNVTTHKYVNPKSKLIVDEFEYKYNGDYMTEAKYREIYYYWDDKINDFKDEGSVRQEDVSYFEYDADGYIEYIRRDDNENGFHPDMHFTWEAIE